MKIKIGQGFDAHQVILNKPLILGGVNIPFEFGLQGHSDADVLTHAIIDSILGALGEGNIGTWFPDNDPKYKNANSLELLKYIMDYHFPYKWRISNIDSTIIAEKPKLTPFIPQIEKKLAEVLRIDISDISVKAKTTEKMGFCGRGEGIAVLVNTLISID